MNTRFRYVPYRDLHLQDQRVVQTRYPHSTPWLPFEEYQYPVRKDGRLARASRHMPGERAKELYEKHIAEEVHES